MEVVEQGALAGSLYHLRGNVVAAWSLAACEGVSSAMVGSVSSSHMTGNKGAFSRAWSATAVSLENRSWK